MYKLLTLVALGLLATACVPHDPDEVVFEPVEVSEQQQMFVPQAEPQPQPVVVVQKQPVQPAQPTWWQTNKQKHVVKIVEPACPCKDPNDPCTHCYHK